MLLLTGGTGFVGRHLVKELTSRGHSLRCLVRGTSNLALLKDSEVEVYYGDLLDPASLEGVVKGVDTVIHLAAIIRERKGATFPRVNGEGTSNLVEASQRAEVKRFVFMSNLGVSPDPNFPFLYSKWEAEEAIKESGIPYTIFRSSVMFGEGDGFVNVLAGLIKRMPLVPVIGAGRTKFQLISVEEVARCVAMALEDERTLGETILLGGPEHLTYEEIIDTVMEALGIKKRKVHLPLTLMKPAVRVMERLWLRFPVTSVQLGMLETNNITRLDAVERAFGFKPRRLRDSIDYVKTAR